MPNEQLKYVVNLESKHIYEVIKYDEAHFYLERIFKFSADQQKHEEGDGYAVRVGVRSIGAKFRPLPEIAIRQVRASLQQDNLDLKKQESVQNKTTPESKDNNIVYETTERDDFNRLILEPEIVETIMTGIKRISMKKELIDVWGLNELRPMEGKLAMNFYGPPGTGKTMAARAVARQLDKKILQVDYANMISKWVGDTAKAIRGAFKDAQKMDAILFFDEADSMLSKRVEQQDGDTSNSINQNRNVLMQELDRFDNIVIFATNFFKNYDEALLRRIAQHVEFKLPSKDSRLKILDLKIPKKARENGKICDSVNLEELADKAINFSGSDLENIVANSIEACATKGEKLNQEQLLKELFKIQNSKKAHGKAKATGYQSSDIGIAHSFKKDVVK